MYGSKIFSTLLKNHYQCTTHCIYNSVVTDLNNLYCKLQLKWKISTKDTLTDLSNDNRLH